MIIPAGTCQANLIFTGSAVPLGAEVTLGLSVDTFTGDPVDVGFTVASAWAGAAMDDFQTSQVALAEIYVKFGPNSTGASGSYTVGNPGDAGSGAVAPNTSALISKNTNFGGRSGRGRMYYPGVPENVVDQAGSLDGTYRSDFQTAVNSWYAALVAADLPPLLLHGSVDAPITTPLPIVSMTVSDRVATQRRRLRR